MAKVEYITFSNNEETIYDVVYGQLGYTEFDKVPQHAQVDYARFLENYDYTAIEEKNVPEAFQGNYHRVKINKKDLPDVFVVGNNFMIIRNPEKIKYDIIYFNNQYRIKNKDQVHGARVGFYSAKSNNKYMLYDGTLYKKM